MPDAAGPGLQKAATRPARPFRCEPSLTSMRRQSMRPRPSPPRRRPPTFPMPPRTEMRSRPSRRRTTRRRTQSRRRCSGYREGQRGRGDREVAPAGGRRQARRPASPLTQADRPIRASLPIGVGPRRATPPEQPTRPRLVGSPGGPGPNLVWGQWSCPGGEWVIPTRRRAGVACGPARSMAGDGVHAGEVSADARSRHGRAVLAGGRVRQVGDHDSHADGEADRYGRPDTAHRAASAALAPPRAASTRSPATGGPRSSPHPTCTPATRSCCGAASPSSSRRRPASAPGVQSREDGLGSGRQAGRHRDEGRAG